jgi:hypothetical protein
MPDSEVKIGMIVKVPDYTKHLEPTTSIVKVKRLLPWTTSAGEKIYETEQEVMDRFHRPYNCISQATAKDMEIAE